MTKRLITVKLKRNSNFNLHTGDCRKILSNLPAGSIRTCVTSPPYWGLRDYGIDTQIGLEQSPDDYVTSIVEVFREIKRVALRHGRKFIGIELNPEYTELAKRRILKSLTKESK